MIAQMSEGFHCCVVQMLQKIAKQGIEKYNKNTQIYMEIQDRKKPRAEDMRIHYIEDEYKRKSGYIKKHNICIQCVNTKRPRPIGLNPLLPPQIPKKNLIIVFSPQNVALRAFKIGQTEFGSSSLIISALTQIPMQFHF